MTSTGITSDGNCRDTASMPLHGVGIATCRGFIGSRQIQHSQEATSANASFDLAVTTSMLTLFIRGSRLIKQQQQALIDRVREISELLAQNSRLQQQAEQTSHRAASESELVLRRLGADLHDGPAQLISFALLRLDAMSASLGGSAAQAAATKEIEGVRSALAEAMSEVRTICSGLSMPRIAGLPIAQAFKTIIAEHERRTATSVEADVDDLPNDTPRLIRETLCRLVREGLNNAFRHAGGVGQCVSAWTRNGDLRVEILDRGAGLVPAANSSSRGGIGLLLLSNSIESLGGKMQFQSNPGEGTRLSAIMPADILKGHSKR